jgi:hypothetical protein
MKQFFQIIYFSFIVLPMAVIFATVIAAKTAVEHIIDQCKIK